MNNKILVLGYGKLGEEIVKQTKWHYISRKKDNFDFCNLSSYAGYLKNYDMIINAIGSTDTYSSDRDNHMAVNYKAVADLSDFCEVTKKKLVAISTDYVYANSVENATEEDIPMPNKTWYAISKLMGDEHVQMRMANCLVIRTSFKPFPFPYDRALTCQVGNFGYTHEIAKLIIALIKKNSNGLYNVGVEKQTIYDLALKSKPDVIPCDLPIHPEMPRDVTMNIDKMKKELNL